MTTKAPNFGPYHIRKWFLQVEDTLANEPGLPADGEPVRKFVVAAALHNPFAGRYEQDLSAFIEPSPMLGQEFGRRIREAAAGVPIQSYGKACLVGMDGEYEHGNALLTNPAANPVREALGGGKAWVPSTGKRGGPGTVIDIPLAHKDALYVRSHYDTVTAMFNDAPNRDELLVIWAFATRGRLHARLGGLKAADIKGQDGLV
ncbi:MAG TPA: amino acid synthesis family protein [Ramlibacter sp.]|nr:amino acid synthesis family protein [Ramlibacter sp.]